MRSVELAKVAAAAETLRLRRIASRQGMRAAYGAGAAVFAIGALVLIHVVIFQVLTPWLVAPIWASVILLAIDLIAAGVLYTMARSNAPDAIETEALEVRRQAVAELRKATTFMALAGETVSLALRFSRVGSRASLMAELASRVLRRG